MSFSNKESLREQIDLYESYDELVFPDIGAVHKTTTAFLNLLSMVLKNKNDSEDYFTENFIKDNKFSYEIMEIIKNQQPAINPDFQSVRKENIREEYIDLLLKTNKFETYSYYYKIKNSIADEEIYSIMKEHTPMDELIGRILGNYPYNSRMQMSGIRDTMRIIPELESMKPSDFKDFLYWLKTLRVDAVARFFRDEDYAEREEELSTFSKDTRNYYRLVHTLNRFLVEMIIDVFYKDIISHFRKASFLVMHTDSSGDMTYEDLKNFKLVRGDFRDIAKSRYYKHVNERVGKDLIEEVKPIEDMTFSFAEYSEDTKNDLRRNIEYLSESYYMREFSDDARSIESLIQSIVNLFEDMISLGLKKEHSLIHERLSLSNDLPSDLRYFSTNDLFKLKRMVKRITRKEESSRSERMRINWLQKADEIKDILDLKISEEQVAIKKLTESEAE